MTREIGATFHDEGGVMARRWWQGEGASRGIDGAERARSMINRVTRWEDLHGLWTESGEMAEFHNDECDEDGRCHFCRALPSGCNFSGCDGRKTPDWRRMTRSLIPSAEGVESMCADCRHPASYCNFFGCNGREEPGWRNPRGRHPRERMAQYDIARDCWIIQIPDGTLGMIRADHVRHDESPSAAFNRLQREESERSRTINLTAEARVLEDRFYGWLSSVQGDSRSRWEQLFMTPGRRVHRLNPQAVCDVHHDVWIVPMGRHLFAQITGEHVTDGENPVDTIRRIWMSTERPAYGSRSLRQGGRVRALEVEIGAAAMIGDISNMTFTRAPVSRETEDSPGFTPEAMARLQGLENVTLEMTGTFDDGSLDQFADIINNERSRRAAEETQRQLKAAELALCRAELEESGGKWRATTRTGELLNYIPSWGDMGYTAEYIRGLERVDVLGRMRRRLGITD